MTATLGDVASVRTQLEQVTTADPPPPFDGEIVIPLTPPLVGRGRSFVNMKGKGDPCVALFNLSIKASGVVLPFDIHALSPTAEPDQKILGGSTLIDYRQERIVLHVTTHELPAELEWLATSERLARCVLEQLSQHIMKQRAWAAQAVAELEAFDSTIAFANAEDLYVTVAVPSANQLSTLMVHLPIDEPHDAAAQGFMGSMLANALRGLWGTSALLRILKDPSDARHATIQSYRHALETSGLKMTDEDPVIIFESVTRART